MPRRGYTMRLPGGGWAHLCVDERERRCTECGRRRASRLCDYPLRGAKAGKTCDRALCATCAAGLRPAGADAETDYCGPHARLVEREGVQRALPLEEARG